MTNSGPESSSGVGSEVGGGVSGALLLIGAAIVTVVIVCLFRKWKSKKKMKRLQMDIFAM